MFICFDLGLLRMSTRSAQAFIQIATAFGLDLVYGTVVFVGFG